MSRRAHGTRNGDKESRDLMRQQPRMVRPSREFLWETYSPTVKQMLWVRRECLEESDKE